MQRNEIESVLILGGGTAGWMAAASLASRFEGSGLKVTLVESEDLGVIGVGEATVPYMKEFVAELGISEPDFMKETSATYKLGIDFVDWLAQGRSFFHSFGGYGATHRRVPFHHYWARACAQGKFSNLDDYCLPALMARHNKFALPNFKKQTELTSFNYAFHLDAIAFARMLSAHAQKKGVERVEGEVINWALCDATGAVASVTLKTGQTLRADLFIDCSGFKGVLIEQALKTGYEDWSNWLLCNSAVAVQSAGDGQMPPYTRAKASTAGWQWKIPLQQRDGNGYVYSNNFISDDEALSGLLGEISGTAITDPKLIRFVTGMRKKIWNKNVFALGLASGFMEPLESTSIYLVQSSLDILFAHFPTKQFDERLIARANDASRRRQERLRDFLILHYWPNQRHGESFWDACRNMIVPSSLSERLMEFKAVGQVSLDDVDFFRMPNWLAMFAGLDILPDHYHPLAGAMDAAVLDEMLGGMRTSLSSFVHKLPTQAEFIRANASILSFEH
jgi:tryptophan 7-halogenase